MKLSSDQVREPCHLIYLWIELTDVAALFTEVEELKKNRQIKSNSTLRKVCDGDCNNPGLQLYICHLGLLFFMLIFTPNDKHSVDQHSQFLTSLCL